MESLRAAGSRGVARRRLFAIIAGVAALVLLVLAYRTPSVSSASAESGPDELAPEVQAEAGELIDQLRDIARQLQAATEPPPIAQFQTLPSYVAWELRDSRGVLLAAAGRAALLPFPASRAEGVADATNGIILQRLLRVRAPDGSDFLGGITLSTTPLSLLEHVRRPSLHDSIEYRRIRSEVPRSQLLIDAAAAALLALGLCLSGRKRWLLEVRGVVLALAISTLASSHLLPFAATLPGLPSAVPWLANLGNGAGTAWGALLTRILPGATPLSLLAGGLLLAAFAVRAVDVWMPHGEESTTDLRSWLAVIGPAAAAAAIFFAVRAATGGLVEIDSLILFSPRAAFSSAPIFAIEIGLIAGALAGTLLALEAALAILSKLRRRHHKLRLLTRALIAGGIGSILVIALLFAAREAKRETTLRSYAGTDESNEADKLRQYLSISMDSIIESLPAQQAIERGDLARIALLLWSNSAIAGVPARIVVEDEATGQKLERSFDLPPDWIADEMNSATLSVQGTVPHGWRVTATIALASEPLVPQSSTVLLQAVRRNSAPELHRLLRARADARGYIQPGGNLPGGEVLPPQVLAGAASEEPAVARLEFADKRFLVTAARAPANPQELAVVGLEVPSRLDSLVRLLRAFLLCLGGISVAWLVAAMRGGLRSAGRREKFLGRFDVRVTLAAACIALVPLGIVSWVAPRIAENARAEATESRFIDAPAAARAWLEKSVDPAQVAGLARALGLDVTIYKEGRRLVSSRPELSELGLVAGRSSGLAVAQLTAGRSVAVVTERLGSLDVPTAYARLRDDLVVAFSMPLGSADIARATAPAVAKLQVFIFAVMVLVVFFAAWSALLVAAPVRALTQAADRVAGGDLDARVKTTVSRAVGSEIAVLVSSFERMVSELKDSRQKIVSAEKAAAWQEMARQVAHEIKNPLTPMRLSIQHLQRAHADQAPEIDRILERVVATVLTEIDNLSRIAEDFSDFARFPQRKMTALDLGTLVGEVAALYAGDGRVSAEVASATAPVQADAAEMRRVLVNLIKNALEAVEARADGHVRLVVGPGGSARPGVVLQVIDNGPGIPADVRSALFEPYFSTKTRGTGLGLAIVKRAIEAYGGTVGATDAPGGGALFELWLPAA